MHRDQLKTASLRRSIVDRAGWAGQAVNSPAPGTGAAIFIAGFQFPAEAITVAERWYLRYGLSYRDVEELQAE